MLKYSEILVKNNEEWVLHEKCVGEYQQVLEKVLLDPIFILKWMNLTHIGSFFETIHDVSASQLEVTKTSSWEAETLWIVVSKHDPKWVKFIYQQVLVKSTSAPPLVGEWYKNDCLPPIGFSVSAGVNSVTSPYHDIIRMTAYLPLGSPSLRESTPSLLLMIS